MSRLRDLVAAAIVLALPIYPAVAQDDRPVSPPAGEEEGEAAQPAPTPPVDLKPLDAAQMSGAVRSDQLSIPTPGELLAALSKVGTPNWQERYRGPIPTTYTNRAQLALNLGGLIADGYLAVQAADAQVVKNTGKDIITLAKALGVSQNVLGRGNSIADFAERNEWGTLKEELEATQNEVKLAMEEQGDKDLVALVTLGGWIRALQIVSNWISENYSPDAAKLLRQPAIVAFMRSKLGALPEKVRDDKLIKLVDEQLKEIEKLVSFPPGEAPSKEQVDAILVETSKLLKAIVQKEPL